MRREISYKDPKSGKTYQLKSKVCLLLSSSWLLCSCYSFCRCLDSFATKTPSTWILLQLAGINGMYV